MTRDLAARTGGNLRTLREAARLSQKQFLARLRDGLGTPMDQSTLSKKERGDRALSIDELLRFAAVLDVSPVELLLPRTPDGDLHLSASLRIPAAQAREWIRGWRRLNRFDGVPDTALTLPDQETHDRLEDLRSAIQRVEIEVQIRKGLIEEAEEEVRVQYAQPTLMDTHETNLTGEPFRRWIEQAKAALEELENKHAALLREVQQVEREAQDDGWMHQDPPDST